MKRATSPQVMTRAMQRARRPGEAGAALMLAGVPAARRTPAALAAAWVLALGLGGAGGRAQAQQGAAAPTQTPPSQSPQSQPAAHTTSADSPGAAGLFDEARAVGGAATAGQETIGPRPYTSFFERLSTPVERIELKPDADNLGADGVSATRVRIELLDSRGVRVREDVDITIEVDGGARVRLPGRRTSEAGVDRGDTDRIQPGVQYLVRAGVAEIELIAPYKPDAVTLKVSVKGVEQKLVLRYVPDLREMIAVGLLEGQLRSDKFDPRQIVPVRENDGFDEEIRHFSREFNGGATRLGARAAMYLKGKVSGQYLLTLAYDSEKQTRRQLFEDIDPNAFYPVYGDSSTRGQDAQSSGKLYVRLDRGLSYAMWGDYTTADPNVARQLSQFNRSLPGARGHYEQGDVVGNAFHARQSMKQIVDEFPGRGVSGPYSVSNPGGIIGSEKIEILVRSRQQNSVILKVVPLASGTDYEFEPFSGQILFRSPVPSFDDQLNPVSVRVTYEVEQGGPKFDVYGADVKLKASEVLTLGVAVARDENPAAPQQILGANVHLKLSRATELVAEVARSSNEVNTNVLNANLSTQFAGRAGQVDGQAVRVEVRHSDERLRAQAHARHSDDGFLNPSAGLAGGRTELGASGVWQINPALSATGEALSSEDRLAGALARQAALGLDLKVSERLTVGGGVRHVQQNAFALAQQTVVGCAGAPPSVTAGNVAGYNNGFGIGQTGNQQIDPSTGLPVVCTSAVNSAALTAPNLERTAAYGRASWRATQRVTLDGELQHVEGTDPADQYRLGARWAATDRLNFNAQMQREFASTSNATSWQAGADWRVADKTRLYGRFERASQYSGAYGLGVGTLNTALAVGVDTQYMRDGNLFSEYRLRDGSGGREVQSAIGLRNGWRLAEGLRMTTNVEHLRATSGDASAAGVGLEYTANPLWKGSGRLEWREDTSNTNYLVTLSGARKLDRNWTLIARDYFSLVSPRTGGAADSRNNRLQLGFAYRPVDHNRFDALGLYERKSQKDLGAGVDSATDIVSLRANYHPSRPWWISGRVAYKQVNELLAGTVNDSYRAALVGTRVTYDITNRWSVGTLLTVLQGTGGGRQWAYGVEAGYILVDNLWVTLGYNWRGFSDDDLAGSNYTNRGWVLGVRYKFDEDLFKGGEARVNKTLQPEAVPTAPTTTPPKP